MQIGRALIKGGPANLFIAFTFWYVLVLAVAAGEQWMGEETETDARD